MTIEESIKLLKIQKPVIGCKEYKKPLMTAYDMAIEALEKQIPKKPYLSGDGYWNGQLVYDTWTCPNCSKSYEVDYDNYDYCPECGQRIDWSEVEE